MHATDAAILVENGWMLNALPCQQNSRRSLDAYKDLSVGAPASIVLSRLTLGWGMKWETDCFYAAF